MVKDVFKDTKWEYGTAEPGTQLARRDPVSGCVQFILWDAGQHGHTDDYWFALVPKYWPTFVPDSNV